jgi:hypothetical protein
MPQRWLWRRGNGGELFPGRGRFGYQWSRSAAGVAAVPCSVLSAGTAECDRRWSGRTRVVVGVRAFVGDLWPSGNPAALRAAASAWRALAAPLHRVSVDVSGADNTIGAQRIGETAQIHAALREIGTGLSQVGSQCEQLARGLEQFADDVEHTQQAIRDLLGKLGSIGGVVGTFFEFVQGHGEEEFHRIVEDIRTVVHYLRTEADAKKELVAHGLAALDSGALRLQAWADREFVDFFGEHVGNALAVNFNNTVDSAEGGVRWLASTAEGVAALDPARFAYDPEGAKQTWQGLADFANALTNPVGNYRADPDKMQTILKGLARTDEWSKGRPALALTQNALDVLSMGVPGLGEAGAAGEAASVAGRVSRAAEVADRAGVAGQAAAKVGEINRGAGALVNPGKGTAGIADKLDGITAKPVTAQPAPAGGRPAPLPAESVGSTATKHPVREGVPAGEHPNAAAAAGQRVPSAVKTLDSATSGSDVVSGSGRDLGTAAHHGGFEGGASVATQANAGAIGDHRHTDAGSAGSANGHDVEANGSGPGDAHSPGTDDHTGSERAPDQPWDIPPLLERDVPYETGGIQPEYVGEQYPGGPMGSPGVRYLSEADRERFRITVRDGLLYDPRGTLCDTSGGVSAFGPDARGRAIFVMDEHGNLYASRRQEFGVFHHSSLLAGGDVAAAGEFIVKDGRIELVTDRSGRYMPGRWQTQQFLDQLASQGVEIDPNRVTFFAPPES